MRDTQGRVSVVLDMEGAAEYTGFTVRQLRTFIGRDEVPSARIGKRRYFRRDDIDAWLEQKFTA